MTLNIKDPKAHQLARKIAEQTGESLTRAVTEALRERLVRLNRARKRETTADALAAIGRRCAATLTGHPVSHAAVVEAQTRSRGDRQLYAFVRRAGITIESVTEEQAHLARQAFTDFGKGRYPAGLNFGDCFAYALAKSTGESLLFKGNDFGKTDVTSAI